MLQNPRKLQKTTWGPILWDILHAKTLILKGYEERRYPSVNQACTVEKYKMPEQEEVVEEEDSDEEEWTAEKVMEWMQSSKKNKKKPENEMFMKLFKYISGVNKKGQEIEMTSPVISTMKREKVSFTYNNASSADQYHTNVIIS